MEKLCSKCMTYKVLDDFYVSSRSKDGRTSWCKECERAKQHTETSKQKAKERYHRNKDRVKKYLADNKERISQRQKDRVKRYKLTVIHHYGGKCECCEESRYEFLSIDHKNKDGWNMRKNNVHPFGGVQLYKWIVDNDYPDYFRILCYNCNLAIGFFGYCPHQTLSE